MPNADFATALELDQEIVAFLWKPDGSKGAAILIRKEIWINSEGKGDGRGGSSRYPVFHLYNQSDPTKAHSPDSCFRTNPLDEPYLDYEVCLADAKRFEQEALASGEWVPLDQVNDK